MKRLLKCVNLFQDESYLLIMVTFFTLTAVQAQTEYLVTVNPGNGNFTKVDSLPGVKWVSVPSSTFDNVNQHYIFRGADANNNWGLYSVDVNTGNIISNPPFPANVSCWEYSNSMNKLLGLRWDNSISTEYFISINTTTGAVTLIDSLPGVKWLQGEKAFDNINNRFIFIGGDNGNWYLYSIDANNGSVIANPPIPGNFIGLQYSNSMDTLYALHWDNSSSTEYLAAINTTTGAFTNINSLSGVTWIVNSNTTFDDLNKRYIFTGGDNSGNSYLYSVDALTGNIISNPIFPVLPNPGENVLMSEADSLTGIFYAVHWGTIAEAIQDYKNNSNICSFSPNPVTDKSKIILDKQYKNIMVFIYNTFGQIVKKLTAYDTSEINIERDDLSDGSYFISIICDHQYSGAIKTTIQ